MKPIEIGNLYFGDTFYYKTEKYRVGYAKGDNTVWCVNVNTKRRKLFSIFSEVEVEVIEHKKE